MLFIYHICLIYVVPLYLGKPHTLGFPNFIISLPGNNKTTLHSRIMHWLVVMWFWKLVGADKGSDKGLALDCHFSFFKAFLILFIFIGYCWNPRVEASHCNI